MFKLLLSFRFLLAIAMFGFGTAALVVALGLPIWCYYVILIALAILLWVAHGALTGRYIARRNPEYLSNQEVIPGVQKWELTAGSGVVPRWVSYLGIASLGALFALLLPLLGMRIH